jgi:hypothetical protein
MATHTFDGGGQDDGTLDVSLFTYYGEEYVWTDTSGESAFGLNAEQARAYAADLITHADALDERNRKSDRGCNAPPVTDVAKRFAL